MAATETDIGMVDILHYPIATITLHSPARTCVPASHSGDLILQMETSPLVDTDGNRVDSSDSENEGQAQQQQREQSLS
jgi:hypothetical protein